MLSVASNPAIIMHSTVVDTYQPALLQAQHWTSAARRLRDLDALASDRAWESLERYLHMELRKKLDESVKILIQKGERLINIIRRSEALPPFNVQHGIELLKDQYIKVETMFDFFAQALSTRTTPEMTAMMRACDRIAQTAMNQFLGPLGHPTPPVLVYLDKGLGASILKAGLRLWDGYTSNPVAAIKITRHNLLRPTALIHEAGHQVAHITGWNDELASGLRARLKGSGEEMAETWAGWSSEIAADAFAFVHTGFASIASLHDVVDGPRGCVFRYLPGDPHPISYLRVQLGIECCRQSFGKGPWNEMRIAWMEKHQVQDAATEIIHLLNSSLKAMPLLAEYILKHPLRVFRGRSLADWIDPANVDPVNLGKIAQEEGTGFYRSHYLVAENPLQKLAWNGFQVATLPDQAERLLGEQREWMLRLGKSI